MRLCSWFLLLCTWLMFESRLSSSVLHFHEFSEVMDVLSLSLSLSLSSENAQSYGLKCGDSCLWWRRRWTLEGWDREGMESPDSKRLCTVCGIALYLLRIYAWWDDESVFDGLGNTHPLWLFDKRAESKIWEPPKVPGVRAPLSPRILGTLPDFTDTGQTGIWVKN